VKCRFFLISAKKNFVISASFLLPKVVIWCCSILSTAFCLISKLTDCYISKTGLDFFYQNQLDESARINRRAATAFFTVVVFSDASVRSDAPA